MSENVSGMSRDPGMSREFEESLWWQGPQLIEEDVRESSTGARVLQLSVELKEGEKQ